VSVRQPDVSRLLRWYPAQWREQYGQELGALIEDTLDGQPAGPRLRVSVACAGLRERGHQSGLAGSSAAPADRARAGFVLVLCAWTGFVIAGCVFASLSDNFRPAVPAGAQGLSSGAYGAVQVAAAVCALAVLTGALAAGPAFGRFLRAGGWGSARRHLLRAAGATAAAAAAVAGLASAARVATYPQRNGGDWLYSLAFIVVALLVWAALALWTRAAAVVAARLTLSRAVLATEVALAVVVTAGMIVMTIATAAWWAVLASSAPWFLQGARPGSASSALTPNLIGTLTLMLAAGAVAAYGTARAARSWRELTLPARRGPGR
jgi:hypothetical protein